MNNHPKSTHEHNESRPISGINDQNGNFNKGQLRTTETKMTDPAATTQKKLDKKNRHRPLL